MSAYAAPHFLRNVILEKEVAWEDNFDIQIARLFEGSFQRSVLRAVITSIPAFRGLGVKVFDSMDAILLTAPWAA